MDRINDINNIKSLHANLINGEYCLSLYVYTSQSIEVHIRTHTKGATCSNKIIKYCRNFCSCYCSYCSFKYNSNAPFKRLCVLIFFSSIVALMSFTGRNTSILLPMVAYSLCAWRLLQFNYWKCFRLTIQAFAHIVCCLHFTMHLPLTRSNIE